MFSYKCNSIFELKTKINMLRTHRNNLSVPNRKRKADFKKEQKAYEILKQCLHNLGIYSEDSIIREFKNKNGQGEINGFKIVLKGIDNATDKAKIERDLYRMEYVYPYTKQYPIGFTDEENSEIATEALSHEEKILNDIKEMVTVKRREMSLAKSFISEFSKIYISLKRNIFEREILKAERLRCKKAHNLIHKKCIVMLLEYTLDELKDTEYFIKVNIKNRQKMTPIMRIGVLVICIAFALLLWNWSTLKILDKTIVSIAGFSVFWKIKDEVVKSFEDFIMASTHIKEDRLDLIQEAIRKKQDEI